MINIEDVTRKFGQQIALNNISLTIPSGQIAGLLGPNGAGKTTLMKIICGSLIPNSGNVEICGLNHAQHSLEIRQKIGFLPEHNPLYTEMYILEYLDHIAGFYNLTNKKQRIDELIEITGLQHEMRKKIGDLSKGYRQRVGLAQALINDPEILILDEPTTGLDPNQIVEIRNLITSLGKEKTVLLSTHIMQEVTSICQRAIIINRGNIVADQPMESLMSNTSDRYIVEVEFANPIETELLMQIETVLKVVVLGKNRFQVMAQSDIRKEIFAMATEKNNPLLTLILKQQSLEEIFQALTR